QLDVYRAAVMARGGEHAVDLPKRDRGVIEHRGRTRDSVEDLALEGERSEAVVDQRVFTLLAHARRAADDHDRRGFRVRSGHGVDDVERSHAVRHGERAETAAAGVTIRG